MRSFSSILLLSTKLLVTHAWSPQLYSDPIVIQIHADTLSGHAELSIRSPANNSIFGAGLTGAALSSDKQYVLPPSSLAVLPIVMTDPITLLFKPAL